MKKIERLVKGSSPTLLDADKGNELIDRANRTFKVHPPSAGRVEENEKEVVFVIGKKAPDEALSLDPFELVDATAAGVTKLRITASTVMGLIPPGFSDGDDPPYVIAVSGSGKVWAKIVRDTSGAGTGVLSVAIETGSSVPSNTATNYYVQIGSYSVESGKVTVSNVRYGPIDGSFCRNWFSNPPEFSLSLS